ncbi:M50 family metallopeptidase [Candidatus Woesearchaeota archaeon]|jgi:Zn-dependent protease|nr:M50 family metallopeptidase [Candidatus Woesearchaeota archaeon]
MFSLQELIDVIIMTLALGFIFKDIFVRPSSPYDPLTYYKKKINLENFKFAIIATAPAVILHELAHKFVAIAYGLEATFHAHYFFLGIGILMKLLNFGFIFFVPGYVIHSGLATHFQTAAIAVAGPLVNLVLWLGSAFILKQKNVKKKYIPLLFLTKKINMFLFIFNMLPIRPFDGGHFFMSIIQALTS